MRYLDYYGVLLFANNQPIQATYLQKLVGKVDKLLKNEN